MPARTRFAAVLRNLVRRKRVEHDLDDELRSYLDLSAEEKRATGLSQAEARRAALIELGGIDQVKESVRSVRAGALAEELGRDLLYAVRLLVRNKAFSLVAIATIAAGIGANTAIFTIVDTVVFRPLPYRDASRLVKIWGTNAGQPADDVSWADFNDIRLQNDVFEQVAADDGMGFEIRYSDGSHESVDGAFVTDGWLSTLGVRPTLGRGFLTEEFDPGRDRVVVMSHAYWQRRFGSSPGVVGTSLVVDGVPMTVIGVLPRNVLRYGADFLRPLVPADYPRDRGHRDLDVVARLKPGVPLARAQTTLDTIGRRLSQAYPTTNAGRGFNLKSLGKYYTLQSPGADKGLVLMLSAVGLVLLIACANVTNLLLARGIARSRECVIRTALGASRLRLVRQMLVESTLLFLAGGALGLLLAEWSVRSLLTFSVAGGYVPERMAVSIDTRVFAFTLLVSLLAGLLSGLTPALHASRVDLREGLQSSSQTSSRGRRRTRASRLLIVGEIAVSLVLLVGSGLMIRSFVQVQATSGGIDAENLLMTASDGGRDFSRAVAFWRSALERTRELPGVQFAAVTSRPPLHGARRQAFDVDSRPGVAAADASRAGDVLVSSDYFRTMGIPLLKGRAFTEQDTAPSPPVAIVSERVARTYFPNGDALGHRISIRERLPLTCCSSAGAVENVWREIVGIVSDVRQTNLDEEPAMTIYRPYSQIVEHDMFLVARAASSEGATRVAAGLRSHLLAFDPGRVWADVRPMQDVIDGSESIRVRRFVLMLLGGFAGLALMLAAIGTYGVMAFSVADRTREIGIRVALGASRPAVLKDVIGDASRLTLVGLAIGAIAAHFLTRFIAALLFGVSSTDPLTYLTVSAVLAAVSLLASYFPARRALRIDPLIALKAE
jgi:putative ABC transport system permease protein